MKLVGTLSSSQVKSPERNLRKCGTRHIQVRSSLCTMLPPRHQPPKTATCGQNRPEEAAHMRKPTKSEAELVAIARAELKVHADCPDRMAISVIRDADSWEFLAHASEAPVAKPAYHESVSL